MQLKINSAYFQKIIAAVVIIFFVFGTFAEGQTRRPKNKKTKQAIKRANDKITYAPDADLLKEMRAQIKTVESKKDWKRFAGSVRLSTKTAIVRRISRIL